MAAPRTPAQPQIQRPKKGDAPVTPKIDPALQRVADKVLNPKAETPEQGDELSNEDRAQLGEPPVAAQLPELEEIETQPAADSPPDWAKIPAGLVLPKGKMIYFIKIPADLTDRPGEGIDRQAIAWNLNVADEDIGLKRARGDQARVTRELTMAMIRAVDGVKADWSMTPGAPGDVRKWMNDIGPRGRILVQNVYIRTHSVDGEVAMRFFVGCFVPMTST